MKQGAATESYWLQRRDPERPQDMALSALGKLWTDQFPLAQRPKSLCRQYPRLANRLALCWPDQQLTGMVLVDLLIDRRGGRRGFPADVQAELRQLLKGILDDMSATEMTEPHREARQLREMEGELDSPAENDGALIKVH